MNNALILIQLAAQVSNLFRPSKAAGVPNPSPSAPRSEFGSADRLGFPFLLSRRVQPVLNFIDSIQMQDPLFNDQLYKQNKTKTRTISCKRAIRITDQPEVVLLHSISGSSMFQLHSFLGRSFRLRLIQFFNNNDVKKNYDLDRSALGRRAIALSCTAD